MAADWQVALLILAIIVILFTSAWIYWRTSDAYRIMQAKKKLGYEVLDFNALVGKCLQCFFGPVYRKNWEKNNKYFRNEDYGPQTKWDEKSDQDPEWLKLPRGDRALQHKTVSTAVAKASARAMEEMWMEALVGAMALYIADLKADHAAQQRLEELRRRAEEIRQTDEQQSRERAAQEEAERREAEEMAAEDDRNADAEENAQLESLEKAQAAGAGVLLNAHMLQPRPQSMLLSASEPGTPMLGLTSIPPANAAVTGAVASSAVIAHLGILSNPLTLAELRRHIRHPETSALLELEFQAIPSNLVTPAELPDGALARCRNATYLPNPGSRVSCQDDNGSDIFLDANYVYGPDGQSKRYVLASTPMAGEPGKENTVADFWRMVVETDTSTIVMMKDNKKARYWPSKTDRIRRAGPVTITWDSETRREGYVRTELFVSLGDKEAGRIMHFLFEDWPAGQDSVSTNTAPLLALIHEVHDCSRTVTRPVLIHSDNAAGPASVFIAVEHGIFQIETQPYVDILRLVAELRIDRGGCVHTIDEYDFVHKALCMYSLALSKVPAPPTYIPTPKFDEAPPPDFSDADGDGDGDSDDAAVAKAQRARRPHVDRKSVYAPLSHEEALRAIRGKRESVDVSALGAPPLLPDDTDDDVDDDVDDDDDDVDDIPVSALGPAPALPEDADAVARRKSSLGEPPQSRAGMPQWKKDFISTGETSSNSQACTRCRGPATTQCSTCAAVFCAKCDSETHKAKDKAAHARRTITGLDVPPPCDSCEVSAATLHCRQCDADFCDSCDGTVVHNVGVARTHTRLPISGAAKAAASASNTTLCATCSVTVAAIICQQCDRALCSSCDHAAHSTPNATAHQRTVVAAGANSMQHFSNASAHQHAAGNA